MLELYIVVPDHVAKLLKDFYDFIYSGITTIPTDYLIQLEKMDNKTREMAESLIDTFCEDLGTSKLNYRLGKN